MEPVMPTSRTARCAHRADCAAWRHRQYVWL